MAAKPQWLPHPSGKYLRGLEINAGRITWALLREGDTRSSSIFLDQPALPLYSTNTAVVTAHYGGGSEGGRHPVRVIPRGLGSARLLAGDKTPAKAGVLDVRVFPRRLLSVAFRNVKTTSWQTHVGGAKVTKLLEVANALFRYQGNIEFRLHGVLSTVTIPGLPAAVDRRGGQGFQSWTGHAAENADITVFFVPDYDNSATAGEEWAGQYKNVIVMEPTIPDNLVGMVFGHELGHYLGLRHPNPAVPDNLMNQTSAGQRHRFKSYLTRNQILHLSDPCRWGDRSYSVCTFQRKARKGLRKLLDLLGEWVP